MTAQMKCGFIHGTGAAVNVELGFVPDYAKVVNISDGNLITEGPLAKVIAFTGGGTVEIKAGDVITGLTSTNVSATVRQVILDSGSWAGGDAAGWFIFNAEDMNGTFGSENAEVNDSGNDDVTVAAQTSNGVATAAAVTSASTAATTITAYVGSAASNAKGMTIGGTVSANGKLLWFEAYRANIDIDQTSVW